MTFHLPVYSARASFSEIEPAQWAMVSINRKKNLLTYSEICLQKVYLWPAQIPIYLCARKGNKSIECNGQLKISNKSNILW